MTRRWLLLDDARILGGGQLFALRLAEADVELTVACSAGSELAARSARHVAADFPDPVPARAPALLGAARRLRRVVASTRPDVVVANSARTGLVAALARVRVPVVHLMHERDSAARASARAVYRRFGSVVAVGANAQATYAEALGKPVGLARNFLLPADFERLAAVRAPRDEARRLGVLARLIPEKGVLELAGELASAESLVVGGARQDEAYARAVEARGVRLLGAVDDVPAFLAGIDVLIVPSTGNEAQPTVIIEALAAGVPVVVRRGIDSPDYDGLPVSAYGTPAELAAALVPAPPAPLDELAWRFGPEQAVVAIEGAARR